MAATSFAPSPRAAVTCGAIPPRYRQPRGGVRFVDEIGFAFGWIALEPRFMQRASHAVASDGRVWVFTFLQGAADLLRKREVG